MSRRRLGLIVALLAAVACRQPEVESKPPRHLWLITVDTLRADRLPAYGYPRDTAPYLSELASQGVVFERAIAQWPKTGPSFASLFTGRYPSSTGLTHAAALRIPQEQLVFPEVLQAAGFTTLAVVSNAVLPAQLGWSQGFDEYLETWRRGEPISEDPREFRRWIGAPVVNELAADLIERNAEAERLFVWLHYSDPHAPYYLPEGFANPFVGDVHDQDQGLIAEDLPPARAIGDERRMGFYLSQYDANVLVADRHIEAVLRRAGELGLLEEALIVFTSDHGEGLGEHEEVFEHGQEPYNTTAHVPLILRFPNETRPGRRIAQPVELLDLFPTVLDVMGLDPGASPLDGMSLTPLLDSFREVEPSVSRPPRYAFSEAGGGQARWRHYRSIQDERWKLIFRPAVELPHIVAPAKFELFDLATDPLESANLVGRHEEEFDRLWQELSGQVDAASSLEDLDDPAQIHSEETLRALRALGYLD